MELVPIHLGMGQPGLPGLGLDDGERLCVRRFDATQNNDCPGFFIAKFRKRGPSVVEEAGGNK